jgi:hypothetical protein
VWHSWRLFERDAEASFTTRNLFLHKLADFGIDAFRMTPEEFDQDLDTLRRSLG